MYPKDVKVAESGGGNIAMGREVKNMMDEQPKETNIPEMWKMAALMEMCPVIIF